LCEPVLLPGYGSAILGGEIVIDRSSKPSFRLRDRRLTFRLMLQPEALRGFLERTGTLPRASGFFARFLIAWPASTQGTRSYRVAPVSMPAVERFGLRIRELLDKPLCTHADGGLQPIDLALSPPAHAAWVQAYDRIERAPGGALPCAGARARRSGGRASGPRRRDRQLAGTCTKPAACSPISTPRTTSAEPSSSTTG
jgi:hypothetical protein